jgi:hypothetical protein
MNRLEPALTPVNTKQNEGSRLASSLLAPQKKFSANLRNHFAEFNPQIKDLPT